MSNEKQDHSNRMTEISISYLSLYLFISFT